METEYQVTVSELPAAVKATLDRESAGSKIKLSEVTETKDGKAFEFVLGKGENQTELVIDNSGKVTKKEQLKDENDEEDEK
jgi:ATP phosphoribosyltransferase regulatory subunit HisZ